MTDEELMKKAKELIGSWIYDKSNKEVRLYAYDCYESDRHDDDVILCCISIDPGDTVFHPCVKEDEVWMSEFKEYYRKIPSSRCVKTWEKIKEHYDRLFKVE